MASRKVILAINVSADGFADHTVGVGAGDELHDFFSDLLDKTGVELLGRVTYEMMAGYWPQVADDPNASASDVKFATKFNEVEKVVFSSSLAKADWMKTKLVKTDASDYVAKLKNQPGKDLYVGGIQLAKSLMKSGLVDEYWLMVHPVVAGSGTRLFPEGIERHNLKLVETRVLKTGVVGLHYKRE